MSASKDLRKRMRNLAEQIRYHDDLYFNQDKQEISDAQYDSLYAELIELEKKHASLRDRKSPTSKVGGSADSTFDKVQHTVPMLSLEKAHSFEETMKYFLRMRKAGAKNCYALPKMDGMAVSLRYEGGKLAYGLTRGDGSVGEDITAAISKVAGVPGKLPQGIPTDLEIRGEVMISTANFARFNEQQRAKNSKEFITPRNTAAGMLRNKTPDPQKLKKLDFFAYWGLQKDGSNLTESAEETFALLERCAVVSRPRIRLALGGWIDETDVFSRKFRTLERIYENYNKSSGYELDGIVLRIGDNQLAGHLGASAKAPRSMLAYKFESMSAQALIRNIEFQIGRTGALTPVAKIDTVKVGGVSISSVTLHNCGLVQKLGICEGDQVEIIRSGDVIPKIVIPGLGEEMALTLAQEKGKKRGKKDAVSLSTEERREIEIEMLAKNLQARRNKNSKPILLPAECPACEGALEWREIMGAKTDVLLCLNEECTGRLRARIKHFVSRKCFDMEGFGGGVVDVLIDEEIVTKPLDLFNLDGEKISALEGFGELSTKKLLAAAEKAKTTTLDRMLCGIGLPGLGTTGAKALAAAFGSLERIKESSPEAISFIEGIEFDVAAAIKKSLAGSLGREIEELRDAGVSWKDAKPAARKIPVVRLLEHANYLSRTKDKDLKDGKPVFSGDLFGDEISPPSLQLSKEFLLCLQVEEAPKSLQSLRRLKPMDCEKLCGGRKQLADKGLAIIKQLLADQQFKSLANELKASLRISWGANKANVSKRPLEGMSLLVTGSLEGYTREGANQLVADSGGKVLGSVSGKLDLLVAGESPGAAKLAKADKLGIRQISAKEFFALLGKGK